MTGRILIVEENADLGDTLREILSDEGHEVLLSTGQTLPRLEGPVDLAFVDLETEATTSLALDRIVGALGETPVVVMSARLVRWRARAFQAGAAACLPKPFSLDALLGLVSTYFAAKQEGPVPGDVRALSPSFLDGLRHMTTEQLDALPFGVVRLDRAGRITAYNRFEADAAGLTRSRVRGRSFADIAPCVMVKEFVDDLGRAFHDVRLDRVMRFIFPHNSAQCLVSVRVYFEPADDGLWLLISKRAGEPARLPVSLEEPRPR